MSVTYYRYTPVDIRRTFNWTNKAVQLAVCKVHYGAGRGTCTMQNSHEVESSAGTVFGLDKGFVSASVNINGSKKVSGTVSWTSAPAPAGSSFKAWAVGTRVTFRMQMWVGHRVTGQSATRWRLESTSASLQAFEPQVGFAVGQ